MWALLIMFTLTALSYNVHLVGATCQGTECYFEDPQVTKAQLRQNMTATIAQVLQKELTLCIIHDHRNNSGETNSTDTKSTDHLQLPRDSTEILSNGHNTSGVYKVRPKVPTGLYNNTVSEAVSVNCDLDTDGGGWTLFQRRHNGLIDLYRGWEDYKRGFGYPHGDYWLGLQTLHWMTSTDELYELRVDLEDFNGKTAHTKYSSFQIGEEHLDFMLILGDYEGTAGDALSYHNYKKFSTKDQDHDDLNTGQCAQSYKGAWWYGNCGYSNLNGLYKGPSQTSSSGMTWYHWRNNWKVLKKSEMKIRHLG